MLFIVKPLVYLSWGDDLCVFVFGDIREDNDVKQETVANILNVKQATYSRYETGQRLIPYPALAILADYYNTSVDYLMGKTNVKNPYKK